MQTKELQKSFIELARRCHSVLVCRATPLQKGQVVKLVKDELQVMTLAIGKTFLTLVFDNLLVIVIWLSSSVVAVPPCAGVVWFSV